MGADGVRVVRSSTGRYLSDKAFFSASGEAIIWMVLSEY